MENQLQLVTFEQAKRLKGLGFDWPTEATFDSKTHNRSKCDGCRGECWSDDAHPYDCEFLSIKKERIPAPTVALALKWMRDVKGLLNGVVPQGITPRNSCYQACWIDEDGDNYTGGYSTYELAESGLLDELLTILKTNKL